MPDEWDTFYLMVGSSGAALIGLLFVVLTLTSEIKPEQAEVGSRIYITPTAYHFGAIVLISCFAVMPETVRPAMPFVVAVPALLGVGYATLSLYRMIWTALTPPHWTDYIYYGLLPILAYLGLAAGGFALGRTEEIGPYAVAISLVALLLIGIRDAWDLATYLSKNREP